MGYPAIKDMSHAAIDETPRQIDWSERDWETWEWWEANLDHPSGKTVVVNGHAIVYPEELEGEDSDYSDGPMMNYFYPLSGYGYSWPSIDPIEDAIRIVRLPLCIVHLMDDHTWGLALTGGGMDLSWEICEAYMRLGYLPPFHFAQGLPLMCDRGLKLKDRWILAGCRHSIQAVRNQAARAIRRLRSNFPARKEAA